MPPPTFQAAPPPRLDSLDAYRGFVMFTLLCGGIFHSLAGHPTWHWLAVQNEHVAWEGTVYWDLIQPAFMYMVGVAMPFAFAVRRSRGDSWGSQAVHAVRRAATLVAIGILLDHVGAERVQIGFIRVLQQIAFGYLAAFLVLGQSLRTQGLVAATILVAYQVLWMFNPWNGPGGPWAIGNQNIGSAFDFWMIGRNYSGYYVGLNAIPATATIIVGVMAGQYLSTSRDKGRTARTLALAGLAGIVAGWLLGVWFPIIKRIWTPSFAVYAAAGQVDDAGRFLLGGRSARVAPVDVSAHRRRFQLDRRVCHRQRVRGWFRDATARGPVCWRPHSARRGCRCCSTAFFALTAWLVLRWCSTAASSSRCDRREPRLDISPRHLPGSELQSARNRAASARKRSGAFSTVRIAAAEQQASVWPRGRRPDRKGRRAAAPIGHDHGQPLIDGLVGAANIVVLGREIDDHVGAAVRSAVSALCRESR